MVLNNSLRVQTSTHLTLIWILRPSDGPQWPYLSNFLSILAFPILTTLKERLPKTASCQGGWVTNMFVTSAELSWVLTQCLDQPRVAEKPGKSPIPLKEVEIWTNHLKPLPGAFTIKPQIVKTPSRCVCHSFAPGRGFDDLWLYSKCTGKGFWRWEGVLWFVAL